MKRAHQRLTFVIIGVGLLAVAAALILNALDDAIVFFQTPSELAATPPATERRLRVGGLVEDGSVEKDGSRVRFRITDTAATLPVTYTGILPDLFREGQGVVAEGRLTNGVFIADTVLAKHDENYMPPEAAESLKRAGQWQHMKQQMQDSGQLPAPAPAAAAAK